MPLYDVRPKTRIGEQIQELAGRLPYREWYLPDPYEPSSYVIPTPIGLTKRMANTYLTRLAEKVTAGRIPAFHGTTLETTEKIAKEGLKGVKFQDVLKETYNSFGVPWETRKQIPKEVRKFIEGDARQRIMGKEGGVLSFAPTRAVAERWAGKGGEVAHETWKRLSEWITAKVKGLSGEQFLDAPSSLYRVPYRNLGAPAVLKAEIPLSSQQQKQMQWIVRAMQKGIEEGDKPKNVLRSFFEIYHDIRIPEEQFGDVIIKKVLPLRKGR